MGAIPIITAAAGLFSTVDGADKARKAANAANDQAKAAAAGTGGGTVNIADLQTQAQDIAKQNAANSAALENQYNPGASTLRSGSLSALNNLVSNIGGQATPTGPGAVTAPNLATAGSRPAIGTAPDAAMIAARPDLGTLPVNANNRALLNQVTTQAGQPLNNVGYDSPLTRAAIAKAQSDLALGGALPQDVRNLVARTALAKSGTVSQGLGLGRDITARDLGLTSLDLSNQRLQAALQAGNAETGLNQGISAQQLAAGQFSRNNLLQSQQATATQQAQDSANFLNLAGLQSSNYNTSQSLAAQRAAQNASNYFNQQGLQQNAYNTDASLLQQQNALNSQNQLQAAGLNSSNYFNQQSLLQSILSGQYGRALGAAQFGQNIAQPASGLDPGSVVNLAVGNSNVAANARQQANAVAAGTANQQTQAGSQLLGTALGFAQNYFKPSGAGTGDSSYLDGGTPGTTPGYATSSAPYTLSGITYP